ncbi:Ku70/Ku80 alpha/beta domain-containing protein [Cladophialophora immunda]|nr:Ku70/Ku80 alpha/beta domain-containing protein [Cladophialophora immunda]
MEKEVTIYIVDLARSMGRKHNGRDQSDLDWALQWVYDKITNVVFTGRKTLQVGVVGLGTDDTDNEMQGDPSYRHISVLQPVAQILMAELQNLPRLLKPSGTDDRDVLSAIIIAVDMMMRHCKHLKYKKKIVVITNATGSPIDDDDIESTAEQFKSNNIELVVLGVDFDDPEYGFKEEDKPELKGKNERILQKLVDLSGGVLGTMQEAIDELSRPQIKPYDTALSIDVERYFKTSVRRPPTASAYVVKPSDGAEQDDAENVTNVHNLYKYKVKGEEYEGGAKVLDREELARGYEYGRTAVPISESEQNITKLETEMTYDILGFIPAENVERYMLMDNTNMIVPQKGNDKAALALSSLIHSLYELGSVAIGRLVKKDMVEPILTLLSPLVEADFECLIENILPFAEDLRSYRFPPLDKVLTVSGKALTEHRNLPSESLLQSMSDFVDSMSLLRDEDEEMMAIDDTFSPLLHTIESAIKYRAVHSSDPEKKNEFPKRPERFDSLQEQPPELRERGKGALRRLIEAADVKKVPSKVKGRRRYRDREAEKPLSGLNVEELFRKTRPSTERGKVHISPDNAIPEFKQLLESTGDMEIVKDAVRQMQEILEGLVKSDFGGQNYPRVVAGLGEMRQELIGYEEPMLYNAVMRQLKEKIFREQLGGNRRELWWTIRKSKLGLISKDEDDRSSVDAVDAEEFLNKVPKPQG